MTNSEIIKFIDTIKDENKIIAAMVSGSYATGQMKQNSDIDVFCVSKNNEISSRGRLFYDNNEYEYFISPEWKYYDRILILIFNLCESILQESSYSMKMMY